MKFFKVILNTVGKDNEKVIFIIPPAEEKDENGNPAYDEDFLLSNTEYRSYLKETKAAVVSVTYILYEVYDSTKLNYDELLQSESSFFKLDQNDYLIEVKKVKTKGGGKKSQTTMYFVLGIVATAILSVLIYGSSLKKSNGKPDSSGDTSNTSVDTYITTEEVQMPITNGEGEANEGNSTDPTVIIETSSEAETISTDLTVTTSTEMVFTLTFDNNGGVGSLNEGQYTNGIVVDLPFTGVNRIGYTLMGWATAPTQPYTLYDNETSKYVMPSFPATLYAIWTATEYEVIYNYQVGTNAVTSKDMVKYGEIIQLMDINSIPSNAGKFVGWALLPNSDEPVKSLTMPDGGIELYAIYKKG